MTASNGGTRPRLLDLFSGAGGAARGYQLAGFHVTGVDIVPQPRYAGDKFILGDALEYGWLGDTEYVFQSYDAIHASPPCQRYSTATKRNGTQDEHPDLIGLTRELLEATGLPYVIENVVGAPLNLERAQLLCGTGFELFSDGYRLRRHRHFECSWRTGWIDHCCCDFFEDVPIMDVTGGGPTHKPRTDGGGGRPYKGTADQARRIMGIDWMTKAELNEAIPPAYTEFIGAQLLKEIGRIPKQDDFRNESVAHKNASIAARKFWDV